MADSAFAEIRRRAGGLGGAREAAALRAESWMLGRRHRKRGRSKLDRHAYELLSLRMAGCTLGELERWLSAVGTPANQSTVGAWLKRNAGALGAAVEGLDGGR